MGGTNGEGAAVESCGDFSAVAVAVGAAEAEEVGVIFERLGVRMVTQQESALETEIGFV